MLRSAYTRDARDVLAGLDDGDDPRVVRRFLSRFERTKLIAWRAEAIANGATTTLVDRPMEDMPSSSIKIAELEFDAGVIPLMLTRHMPFGGTHLIDPMALGREHHGVATHHRACPPAPEPNTLIKMTGKPGKKDQVMINSFRGRHKATAGLWLTTVSMFSVTRHAAKKVLERILRTEMEAVRADADADPVVAIDGCACIGSDTSLIAELGARVVAVEYDAKNFRALEHNVEALGLSPTVTAVPGDIVEVLRSPRDHHNAGAAAGAHLVYFDPPWGGPSYHEKRDLQLRVGGVLLHDLIGMVPETVVSVVLKLPYNYHFDSLATRVPGGRSDNGFVRHSITPSRNIRFVVLRRRRRRTAAS